MDIVPLQSVISLFIISLEKSGKDFNSTPSTEVNVFCIGFSTCLNAVFCRADVSILF